MKTATLIHSLAAAVLLGGLPSALCAADEPTDPAPPPNAPTREQFRDLLKNLTPEERQLRMKEMRQRLAQRSGLTLDEIEKRRQEFEKLRESVKDLPLEQRQARLREWREKQPFFHRDLQTFTPEEGEAKRKELRARLESQLAGLRRKKADGSLTEEEQRRLERMEQWTKNLDQRPATPGGRPRLLRERDSIPDNRLPPPTTPAKPAESK